MCGRDAVSGASELGTRCGRDARQAAPIPYSYAAAGEKRIVSALACSDANSGGLLRGYFPASCLSEIFARRRDALGPMGPRPLERGRDAIPVGADTCVLCRSPRSRHGMANKQELLAWLMDSARTFPRRRECHSAPRRSDGRGSPASIPSRPTASVIGGATERGMAANPAKFGCSCRRSAMGIAACRSASEHHRASPSPDAGSGG